MAEESDAAEIQKDRERQRAAERRRIAKDREERLAAVARLRSADVRGEAPPARESPARRSGRAPDAGGEPRERVPEVKVGPPEGRGLSQPIGGPIRPPEVEAFLATDPTDRFDIVRANRLRVTTLVRSAGGDRALLDEIARRAAALMARVKQEVDDPLNAGAFLRERVLEWYRESPATPEWRQDVGDRWAGLFADSRVSGGRLQPWLNQRLWATREEALKATRVALRLRRGLLGDRREQSTVARTPHQQIVAEVAQAILDDLASHPREAGAPCPLVRLSELAVRRQVATVNDVLALLFSSPESGPFVVLHPNRYPDVEELTIRAPVSSAAGAALAYSLTPGRPGRRGAGRASGGEGSGLDRSETARGSTYGGEGDDELDASTVWEAEDVDGAVWRRIATERRRSRHRLDPPPKDYRSRPAYEALRSLVLESADFRKQFLTIAWRGRPSGLPLLATLLVRGKLVPEVATDHEYLDAELEAARNDAGGAATAEGVWTVGGWTVRREGSHGEGFRYVAESGAATP